MARKRRRAAPARRARHRVGVAAAAGPARAPRPAPRHRRRRGDQRQPVLRPRVRAAPAVPARPPLGPTPDGPAGARRRPRRAPGCASRGCPRRRAPSWCTRPSWAASIDPDTVAAMADESVDAVLDLLDLGLASGLLEERGLGYAFAHALTRETIYGEVSAARRMRLHARAAGVLEDRVGERPDQAAAIAHHAAMAAPLGDEQTRAALVLAVPAGPGRAGPPGPCRGARPLASGRGHRRGPHARTGNGCRRCRGEAETLLRLGLHRRGHRRRRADRRRGARARAVGPRRRRRLDPQPGGVWSWRQHGDQRGSTFIACSPRRSITSTRCARPAWRHPLMEHDYAWDGAVVDEYGERAVRLAREIGDPALLREVLFLRYIVGARRRARGERADRAGGGAARPRPAGRAGRRRAVPPRRVASHETGAGRGVRPRHGPVRREGRGAAAQRRRHPARLVGVRPGPRPRGPRRPRAGMTRPDAAPEQRLPRRATWELACAPRRPATRRCRRRSATPCSRDVPRCGRRSPTPCSLTATRKRRTTCSATRSRRTPPTTRSSAADACRVAVLAHDRPRGGAAPPQLGRLRPDEGRSRNYGSIDHLGAVDYFLALGEHALGDGRGRPGARAQRRRAARARLDNAALAAPRRALLAELECTQGAD